MTKYIVLRQFKEQAGELVVYEVFGVQEAATGDSAIRASLEGQDEGGVFVAVPERSFQVDTYDIEKYIRRVKGTA
jgi:hypothetical protein